MRSPEYEPLSTRQAEIAGLIARGKSTREIADALHLSSRTVEGHVTAIFNKMGVRSRVELAAALLTTLPPRPVGVAPNNLPRKLTSFIGRETEIAAIGALVESQQLVTVVGSAGVGKTSTSLQVAAKVLTQFSDGVWFIELAPLMDGEYIPATVARVLSLRLSVEGDQLASLVMQLKAKRALLIFDNCEHLIDPVAAMVAAILRDCKQVKILSSSREHLRVVGESALRMPSLAVPSALRVREPKAVDILNYDAVRLFVDRASAVDNRFALSDDNAYSVGEICRRLDGIPLAIELAAARIAILSPRQLRDQLDERFRILTGGKRDAVPRHRTLRALIDWSHDLLNERERLVFRRLSIFANGFTLEAAVALLCEDLKEHEIFDGLASLVDKSLIVTDSGPDSVRYRLLESTRAYAAERLATAGDDEFAARLHRRYFRDLFAAKRAREDESVQSFRAESTSALLTELDNVRAALDSAVAPAEIVVAGDLLAQLTVSWAFIGLGREGETRLEEILPKLPQNEPKLHVCVLSTLSLTLVITGRRLAYAFDLATLALAYARTSGDDRTLAWALAYFTSAAISNRRFEVAEKALAELAALPNKAVRLRLLFLGYRQLLAFMRGDFEGVVSAHALAIEESQSFGALEAVRDDTYHVAASELALGRSRRAIDLQREGVKRYRASGHPWLAHNLESLAVFLAWAGDLDEAAKAAREAIELLADKDLSDPAPDIDEHAFILALRGNYEGAALLEGSAEAALQRNANERNPFMALIHNRVMVLLHERLQADELHDLASRGAALTWAETVSLLMDEYDSSC